MISQTEENYLKALFTLTLSRGEATANEISKMLQIKMPTVNSMMKRLAEKDLVVYESYKPVKLTLEGRRQAALIIRKHRLTEMFLVEKMGFGWEEVHHIAEQIEHIKAQEFFDKMDALLGFPKFDPHGSPIPDADGNMANDQYRKLSDCSAGETVKFAAVKSSSEELLKFLNSRELSLATTIAVGDTESFDQSMHVSYNGRQELLSAKVCEQLLVTPLDAKSS